MFWSPRRLLANCSKLGKKPAQQLATRRFQTAARSFYLMIQTCVLGNLKKTTRCSGLGICSAINQTAHASIYQRSSTHHAWLQGDVKGSTIESPPLDPTASFANRNHFCVTAGIVQRLPAIPAAPNDCAIEHDNCPDRHVLMLGSKLRQGDRFGHPPLVPGQDRLTLLICRHQDGSGCNLVRVRFHRGPGGIALESSLRRLSRNDLCRAGGGLAWHLARGPTGGGATPARLWVSPAT